MLTPILLIIMWTICYKKDDGNVCKSYQQHPWDLNTCNRPTALHEGSLRTRLVSSWGNFSNFESSSDQDGQDVVMSSNIS